MSEANDDRIDLTDEEILAFIARIQTGGGRRHYPAVRRPEDAEAQSQ